jgi:hypothetical protein
MGFLLRSAFWLGLVFHAMSWGDARLTDFVPSPSQTLAAGLAAQSGDSQAVSAIAGAVLRGALEPQTASAAKTAARFDPSPKTKRPSLDTLSAADRLPVWRGAALRGTL